MPTSAYIEDRGRPCLRQDRYEYVAGLRCADLRRAPGFLPARPQLALARIFAVRRRR